MDAQEHARRWHRSHGVDATSSLARVWLDVVHRLATPLARAGLSPNALTAAGLLLATAAVPVALAGGRWTVAASALVALSGVVDGLDGAVARLRGAESRWGAVLDAAADRLGEVAFALVLWTLGAPVSVVVAAAGVGWFLEYVRERAAAAVVAVPVVITVSERPTRVVVVAMFTLAAGVLPDAASTWAGAGAWAWVVTGVAGVVQLVRGWGRLPR